MAAGYHVDLVPAEENSAAGLLNEWPTATGGQVPLRVLALRSAIAKPLLTEGLRRIGHSVESVIAYRTVGVSVDEKIKAEVASGAVNAILVTSGSVAEQVYLQFGSLPEATFVVCIGPQTARDARAAGLRVDVVARERSAQALIDAVALVAADRPNS